VKNPADSRILLDFRGTRIRLTEERLGHILQHPEMRGAMSKIEETLLDPEFVVESRVDPQIRLYYRAYDFPLLQMKYLTVVVKSGTRDHFIVTAYLTDKVKKGRTLWQK